MFKVLCDLESYEVPSKSASCNDNFLGLFCTLLDIKNCLFFLYIYLIYLNFVSLTFGHLFTIPLLYKSQIKRISVHLGYNHDWLVILYVWPRSCKCTCMSTFMKKKMISNICLNLQYNYSPFNKKKTTTKKLSNPSLETPNFLWIRT